ncbi:YqzE family protein [Ectobacillus panaciterrae]|uniref:YqzE family protein n=1 Tax=Ectobacillus panaciterrae TaxID=363872 RepID=UPI00041D99C2|nr:YqzE family protein [Ectobacillus panaciterrae]
MSTNDYVKFVTQQFVTYMDSPKQDRKQKRQQRRSEREPFLSRWFGVLPLSIALLYRKSADEQDEKRAE